MFAVVHVPSFSLQAILRHEPDLWKKPVALVDASVRTPVLCEMTEAAEAAGVAPGLTPVQAMARCGNIIIRSRSLRQESAAMTAILQCAYAFSPHLEATGPGICTLDLQRLAGLAGADHAALERWATQVQQTFARLGFTVALGLGATPAVARHAARWGKRIEIIEDAKAFIAALPLSALDPSTDAFSILKRWGVRSVGELLALGQDALTTRLGLEALALFAAASDQALRPLHLVQPPEQFEETFDFAPEVETLEPLLFVLRRFVDQFSPRLQHRGFVAETLVLHLLLESGEKLAARLSLPQPTSQPDVLFRTLNTYLETLRTEAAIKSVSLLVLPVQHPQKQLGLFETILPNPHQFQETLARLAAALGPDRVGTPALENSHRPDAFRLAPPDFENAPVPAQTGNCSPVHSLPIRRFRPAIKAEVECSPGPVSICCSMTRGKLRILIGPWRASGDWWHLDAWEREEWDAATSDGQVIRLVHQADGWFVEGVID